MITFDDARRAWERAIALDDVAVTDPSMRADVADAWDVAADAAEEIGRISDATAARQLARAGRTLYQGAPWPLLGKSWRAPWPAHEVPEGGGTDG